MKISLCLLTWNEIHGCQLDVPQLPLDEFHECYAVDGGSEDGTIEYLESSGITVYKQEILGYNGAYITAFRKSSAEAVIFFHPKGSVDPSVVLDIKKRLEAGYDLVIASRMSKGGGNEEDEQLIKHRKWFVLTLAFAVQLIWKRDGPIIWDVLHGFRGMRVDSFESIRPLENGLTIDLEMVLRGYKQRLDSCEIPVIEAPRPGGETHFKAWPTGKKLLKYLLWELVVRRD